MPAFFPPPGGLPAHREPPAGGGAQAIPWSFRKAYVKFRPTVTQLIFAGMGIGLLVGWFFPDLGVTLRPLSVIFIRLIKSLIAPLIFATLVVGIAGHGNLKQVGRMGIKALVYFEIVTTLALLIGLVAVNLTRPGVGVHLQAAPGGRRSR